MSVREINRGASWLTGMVCWFTVVPNVCSLGVERSGQATEQPESPSSSVELFDAILQREIEVRFIPQSPAQAVVFLENLADKPLDIRLPETFGAVHVLAQVGGGYGGGGFGAGGLGAGGLGAGGLGAGGQGFQQAGAGLGGGGGQGLGGGFGGGLGGGGGGLNGAFNGGGLGAGGGFNGGGALGGGGFFRIEPGKTRKLVVNTVCLEHGKPNPNPRMTYKLVALEKVNDNPAIAKLCQRLGEGRVPQNVAQAAAWHLANDLSWEELQVKNRHESKYTGNVRWFTPSELESAWKLTQTFLKQSKDETISLSER